MKINKLARFAVGAALLAIAAPALTQSAPNAARYGSFGVDLTSIDKSVKPGDDFWTYVNGGWDKRTEIAADRASAGYGVKLTEEAEVNVRKILDDMAANPAQFGAKGKQIGDFYHSWMDEAGIEARGTAPLKPYLDRINAANDKQAIQVLFASTGYASPVGFGQIPNLADPTRYMAAVGQGGLGMPSDYYLLEGAKYDGFRTAYRAYIQKMLELTGIADASAKADTIFALETALAKVHWTPVQSRDIAKLNDPQTPAGLKAKAPDWDWDLMLKTSGYASAPTVLMTNNTALIEEGKIFTATPVQVWKDYLTFHFVSDNALFLPKVFDDTRFDFYSKTLAGTQTKRERLKRGIQIVNGALGESIGEIYVARHFPPAAKAKMTELIENLRGAYQDGRADPQGRARQAGGVRAAHRLSGQIYRLFVDGDRPQRRAGQRDAFGGIRASARAVALPQSGRPQPVGHDPADGERILQSAGQPDHLPGRDPPAALFRRERRRGGELWRDRRDHRP